MKRLTAIILSALLLLTVFTFTSCDQASVDSTLDNLINTGKDLLGQFFKIAESSSSNNDNSDADVDQDTEPKDEGTTDVEPEGEDTADTEPEDDSTVGDTTDGEPDDITAEGEATEDTGIADNNSAEN